MKYLCKIESGKEREWELVEAQGESDAAIKALSKWNIDNYNFMRDGAEFRVHVREEYSSMANVYTIVHEHASRYAIRITSGISTGNSL